MSKTCQSCEKDLLSDYANCCHHCYKRINEINPRWVNEKKLTFNEVVKAATSDDIPFPSKFGGKKSNDPKFEIKYFKEWKKDLRKGKTTYTQQKLDDGTIIIREFEYGEYGIEVAVGFFKKIIGTDDRNPMKNTNRDFKEYIYHTDGLIIKQEWNFRKKTRDTITTYAYSYAGSGNLYLSSFKIDDSDNPRNNTKYWLTWWNWQRECYLNHVWIREFHSNRVDKNGWRIPSSDLDIKYYKAVSENPVMHKIIEKRNESCTSAKYYDPNGKLIYSINNGNGYMIDKYYSDGRLIPRNHLSFWICSNGELDYSTDVSYFDDLPTSPKYLKAREYVESLEARDNQRKRDEVRREEYYENIEKLEEDFNPTQYHKNCPDCFEKIKLPAKICHFCKITFSDEEIQSHISEKLEELKGDL